MHSTPEDLSSVNEGLGISGEPYLDVAWVDSWDDELRRMNDGKRGRPYAYPESLMAFLRLFQSFLDTPLRQTEGFLRRPAEIVLLVPPPSITSGTAKLHARSVGETFS